MRTRWIRAAAVLLVGAASLLPAACASGPAAPTETAAPVAETTAAAAPTQSPTPTPTQTPTPTPTCADLTGEEALDRWVGDVPPPEMLPGATWDPSYADVEGYDPCAALSWIVLPVSGGTVSSPNHVMLFHAGEYLGTATKIPYGFWPRVVRLDDAAVEVTYTFPVGGESNAEASGRAVAEFAWDDASSSVVMTGEVPVYGGHD